VERLAFGVKYVGGFALAVLAGTDLEESIHFGDGGSPSNKCKEPSSPQRVWETMRVVRKRLPQIRSMFPAQMGTGASSE
jgi:hypothetical protein